MRNFTVGFLLAVALTAAYLAYADQSSYPPPVMTQAQVACNFETATTQKVTITSSSAATSSATGKGQVYVTCTADAWVRQAAFGATGVTATSGNSLYVPQYTPWPMYSRGSLFGFLRADTDTCPEEGCFCQVAECM